MLVAALFATNLGTTRKLVLRLVVAASVTAETTTLETALSKNKMLSPVTRSSDEEGCTLAIKIRRS